MNKIELLNEKFIQARKDKDEVAKALYSTFRGELDTAIKKGSPADDVLVEKLAKKMTENAKIVGTEEANREIELLKLFMPTMMNESEIRIIVQRVIELNPDKANNYKLGSKGSMTGMVMKEVAGKADSSLVQKIIEDVLS